MQMCPIIHAHLLPYCSKLVKISADCFPQLFSFTFLNKHKDPQNLADALKALTIPPALSRVHGSACID